MVLLGKTADLSGGMGSSTTADIPGLDRIGCGVDRNNKKVFKSLGVDKKSKTPYSDATQVRQKRSIYVAAATK